MRRMLWCRQWYWMERQMLVGMNNSTDMEDMEDMEETTVNEKGSTCKHLERWVLTIGEEDCYHMARTEMMEVQGRSGVNDHGIATHPSMMALSNRYVPMRDVIGNARCKINVVSLMMVDEDITMTQPYSGGDMERWDYVEEQYRGRDHCHTIIMDSSTAIEGM
jgi:hypothetical protein